MSVGITMRTRITRCFETSVFDRYRNLSTMRSSTRTMSVPSVPLYTGNKQSLLGYGTLQASKKKALRAAFDSGYRLISTVHDTMSVPSVALNTGNQQPMLGYGTWQASNPDELKKALRVALDSGYRLIDTAQIYGNEAVIGEVLEEYYKTGKLKREDIFITTKLPFFAMEPAEVEKLIPEQLKSLRTDYIDLYLVHCPCPFKFKDPSNPSIKDTDVIALDVPHIDTWRVLEKFYKSGALKALGLSNFNGKQIQAVYDQAEVKPANVQVECYIYWPQFELHELCKKLGMTFTAYGPIGSPGRKSGFPADWPDAFPLEDPVVLELSKKYNKTPAQILLRHLTQRGITVIPKSVTPSRVVENFTIFDFALTADELKKLDSIEKRVRLFEFPFWKASKFFPFEDVKFN